MHKRNLAFQKAIVSDESKPLDMKSSKIERRPESGDSPLKKQIIMVNKQVIKMPLKL